MIIQKRYYDKDKLILFFNGWGIGTSFFDGYINNFYDIFYVGDYCCIDFDDKLLSEINNYSEVIVVGYSLGVYCLMYALSKYNIKRNKIIGINGSCVPRSDIYGIPEAVYDGTLENLDKKNMLNFYRRVFDSNIYYKQAELNDYKLDELKRQLQFIKDLSMGDGSSNIEIKFDNVLISNKDKIFPYGNLIRYWGNKSNIINIDSGHFPFLKWKGWSELIDAV